MMYSFGLKNLPLIRRPCISMNMDSSVLSLAAGSAAGAVGVLAAYPFDSLKTKAQTFQGGELPLQCLSHIEIIFYIWCRSKSWSGGDVQGRHEGRGSKWFL